MHQDWDSQFIRQYNVRVQRDKNTHTATGSVYTTAESFLYVEEKLTKNKVVRVLTWLEDNCIAFIFDEIWYELKGVENDRNRNVDIISTFKNYVTVSSDRSVILQNTGRIQSFAVGYFNFHVPLYVLLKFCGDYKRMVVKFVTSWFRYKYAITRIVWREIRR